MKKKSIFVASFVTPLALIAAYCIGNANAFVEENFSHSTEYNSSKILSKLEIASTHISYIQDSIY